MGARVELAPMCLARRRHDWDYLFACSCGREVQRRGSHHRVGARWSVAPSGLGRGIPPKRGLAGHPSLFYAGLDPVIWIMRARVACMDAAPHGSIKPWLLLGFCMGFLWPPSA